jgi:hypothetical protein
MKISEIQKNKFYEMGNKLPKCVNLGCENSVAVRSWSNWSFKTECGKCQNDRKKGVVREGIIIHKNFIKSSFFANLVKLTITK